MRAVRLGVLLTAAVVVAACGSDSTAVPVSSEPVETTTPTTAAVTTTIETAPPPTTTSPSSSSAPTSAATTTPAPRPCVRIDDFEVDDATWFVVNDGVMGGRSDGRFVIENSWLRFGGTVVTEGGGFTSVRLRLGGDELAGSDRVELRLRADERVYGLTFEDDAEFQGRRVSHRADLAPVGPVDEDGFRVVTMRYDALTPSIFGRVVESAPFDPDAAREIGIIIADGVDGPFALDVDWIDACRPG